MEYILVEKSKKPQRNLFTRTKEDVVFHDIYTIASFLAHSSYFKYIFFPIFENDKICSRFDFHPIFFTQNSQNILQEKTFSLFTKKIFILFVGKIAHEIVWKKIYFLFFSEAVC